MTEIKDRRKNIDKSNAEIEAVEAFVQQYKRLPYVGPKLDKNDYFEAINVSAAWHCLKHNPPKILRERVEKLKTDYPTKQNHIRDQKGLPPKGSFNSEALLARIEDFMNKTGRQPRMCMNEKQCDFHNGANVSTGWNSLLKQTYLGSFLPEYQIEKIKELDAKFPTYREHYRGEGVATTEKEINERKVLREKRIDKAIERQALAYEEDRAQIIDSRIDILEEWMKLKKMQPPNGSHNREVYKNVSIATWTYYVRSAGKGFPKGHVHASTFRLNNQQKTRVRDLCKTYPTFQAVLLSEKLSQKDRNKKAERELRKAEIEKKSALLASVLGLGLISQRDARCYELMYFKEEGQVPQREVAEQIGISRSYVSRILLSVETLIEQAKKEIINKELEPIKEEEAAKKESEIKKPRTYEPTIKLKITFEK